MTFLNPMALKCHLQKEEKRATEQTFVNVNEPGPTNFIHDVNRQNCQEKKCWPLQEQT